MTTTYEGGCHCKKVRYTVSAELTTALECNCSICSKKGSLLAFVPADAFEQVSGKDALTDYQFNKHAIHHFFCSTCGIGSFSRGVGPDGTEMVAINVRCVDDFDLASIKISHFDGKSV